MSNEHKTAAEELRKPAEPVKPQSTYEPAPDFDYRGVDPADPFRLRNPKNAKRVLPRNSQAQGTDFDPHET